MSTRTPCPLPRVAAIAATLVALVLHPIASAGDEEPDTIQLIVVDRSGISAPEEPMPTLYIASNANGWDPGSDGTDELAISLDSDDFAWVFDLARDVASRPGFQFKFTRGSWDTVEVDDNGADIPNRTLEDHDTANAAQIVLVIHGFADQRGTRWPLVSPARESTVLGEVDVFTLHSDTLPRRPTIRVWIPPGYHEPANAERRYPVMYMHDGQNVFDARTSFAGEWGMDETVTALVDAGSIEPLIVVGIDNAGDSRAAEYNPPDTEWNGRGNYADRYVAFIADELMPVINERYRTRAGPEHTGLGGSSFGGNATLYAVVARPGLFSRALIESPAVAAFEGALLGAARAHSGPWPQRVFIGVGTRETAARAEAEAYIESVKRLDRILRGAGLGSDRLRLVVEEGAEHNEPAWARRLPEAMTFLWSEPD